MWRTYRFPPTPSLDGKGQTAYAGKGFLEGLPRSSAPIPRTPFQTRRQYRRVAKSGDDERTPNQQVSVGASLRSQNWRGFSRGFEEIVQLGRVESIFYIVARQGTKSPGAPKTPGLRDSTRIEITKETTAKKQQREQPSSEQIKRARLGSVDRCVC